MDGILPSNGCNVNSDILFHDDFEVQFFPSVRVIVSPELTATFGSLIRKSFSKWGRHD